MGARLDTAVGRFAQALPAEQVRSAALVFETATSPGTAAPALHAVVPTGRFQASATDLLAAWNTAASVPGPAIALALRAASGAVAAERAAQQVEIVWTGPPVTGIPVRYTHGVLVELVNTAHEHLTMVSFAAYRTKAVTDALRAAANRGVKVRLVLDGGTDAHLAFKSLGDAVELFTWPPTLLAEHDPEHASLHAKAAIADGQVAFVTSANLTGHALDRNMELGLLVAGGPVPRRLADHFHGLIATAVLIPWQA
jgi:phosphatidylserine/phosphatidylglycerophosphate/cardiolipin synthase-like enzyme